jgi:hypothetical protein
VISSIALNTQALQEPSGSSVENSIIQIDLTINSEPRIVDPEFRAIRFVSSHTMTIDQHNVAISDQFLHSPTLFKVYNSNGEHQHSYFYKSMTTPIEQTRDIISRCHYQPTYHEIAFDTNNNPLFTRIYASIIAPPRTRKFMSYPKYEPNTDLKIKSILIIEKEMLNPYKQLILQIQLK